MSILSGLMNSNATSDAATTTSDAALKAAQIQADAATNAASLQSADAMAAAQMQADAALQAAQIQADMEQKAIDLQQGMYVTNLARSQPWVDSGHNALTTLNSILPSLTKPYNLQSYYQSPEYAAQASAVKGQNNQISALADAQGAYGSGAMANAIASNAQNQALQGYQTGLNDYWNQNSNIYNMWNTQSQLGQNAAALVGNMGTQVANAEAQALAASGNAQAAGINTAGAAGAAGLNQSAAAQASGYLNSANAIASGMNSAAAAQAAGLTGSTSALTNAFGSAEGMTATALMKYLYGSTGTGSAASSLITNPWTDTTGNFGLSNDFWSSGLGSSSSGLFGSGLTSALYDWGGTSAAGSAADSAMYLLA